MAHVALSAQQRTQFGNGPTRRLRREGLVPGVIYQSGGPSVPLAVGSRELRRALADGGRTGVIDLTIADDRTRPVLLKDWQLHPVRGDLTHIDFQEVDLTQEVHVQVAVTLVGTPVGVREGGVLDQSLRDVAVTALPDALPEHIEVDVAGLDIGGVVTVADIVAPDGVTIVTDSDIVLASVVPPSNIEEPEAEAETEAEAEADE